MVLCRLRKEHENVVLSLDVASHDGAHQPVKDACDGRMELQAVVKKVPEHM